MGARNEDIIPKLKGEPTLYCDRWFDSRTEAHWAAVFRALGVPWFRGNNEMPSRPFGVQPDLWLPEMQGGIWFEAKGTYAAARLPEAIEKFQRCAKETGWPVALVIDRPPQPKSLTCCGPKGSRPTMFFWDASGEEHDDHWLSVCPSCGLVGITPGGDAGLLPCKHVPAKTFTGDHRWIRSAFVYSLQHEWYRGNPYIKTEPSLPKLGPPDDSEEATIRQRADEPWLKLVEPQTKQTKPELQTAVESQHDMLNPEPNKPKPQSTTTEAARESETRVLNPEPANGSNPSPVVPPRQEWLDAATCARLLGITLRSVYRKATAGDLEVMTLAGRKLYRPVVRDLSGPTSTEHARKVVISTSSVPAGLIETLLTLLVWKPLTAICRKGLALARGKHASK